MFWFGGGEHLDEVSFHQSTFKYGYCFIFLSEVYFGYCSQGHVADDMASKKGT